MSWSAAQYTVFEDERTRPVRDLLSAVPDLDVRVAADLGCGPGNSTELLAKRFPSARITGLDSSADMIAAARRRLPCVGFDIGDIGKWAPSEAPDFILSNAALQWVPDHATLLPRLVGCLAAGGVLAVQIPDNLDEPSQVLMRRVAEEAPWADRLASAAGERTIIESADWYYRLLRPLCARIDIWRTTYYHALAGADGVVAWFSGTGLLPFLAPLNDPERARYLELYRDAVAAAYAALPEGSILLGMPRLFFVVRK